MKKFSKINEEITLFGPEQLRAGVEIEKEHGDIYRQLDSYLDSFNVPLPWTEEEFYEKIALAHLKEMPDYYDKLKKMENEG